MIVRISGILVDKVGPFSALVIAKLITDRAREKNGLVLSSLYFALNERPRVSDSPSHDKRQ